MQGQARDDGAEVGVRERQAVGKIYAFRFGFRRPPTGELKRLLREVRGDDFEAPSRETLGILSGAAAEVEDGRVDVRLKEVSPAFQPGVFAARSLIQPGENSVPFLPGVHRHLPLSPSAGPRPVRWLSASRRFPALPVGLPQGVLDVPVLVALDAPRPFLVERPHIRQPRLLHHAS